MKLEAGMAAVVTGGASGLGRASAKALADAGMKVAIFDINDEDGKDHAAAIGGTFHHVDIMDESSVEEGFAAATRRQWARTRDGSLRHGEQARQDHWL